MSLRKPRFVQSKRTSADLGGQGSGELRSGLVHELATLRVSREDDLGVGALGSGLCRMLVDAA